MNRKLIRKLHIVGFLILLPLIALILWYSGFDYEGASHDEKIFKESYESYNLKKNENNEEYLKVNITKDNKIEYIDVDTAISKLNKGTSLIFMGSPKDSMSRAYVETIINTITELNVDKLYYLEISYEEEKDYSKLVSAVGENTLILPRIDAIRNGEVIGVIENIFEDGQDINKGLNEEQKKDLKNAIKVLVDDLNKNDNVCNEEC